MDRPVVEINRVKSCKCHQRLVATSCCYETASQPMINPEKVTLR